jgi:hypothetical protein
MPVDPVSYAAEVAGRFVGTAMGFALKIAGPQIQEILKNAIIGALKDSAEMGGSNAALDAMWLHRKDETRDPQAGGVGSNSGAKPSSDAEQRRELGDRGSEAPNWDFISGSSNHSGSD